MPNRIGTSSRVAGWVALGATLFSCGPVDTGLAVEGASAPRERESDASSPVDAPAGPTNATPLVSRAEAVDLVSELRGRFVGRREADAIEPDDEGVKSRRV